MIGELEIRPDDYVARVNGRTLVLSLRELHLLYALAEREGRVVTREELYETVWGGELRADDRIVDVYVAKLRRKLHSALPDRAYIHTHFGLGYRLHPEPSRPFHTPVSDR